MIEFEKTQLANGLKVIAHFDGSTPFVAVNVCYNVGSKHENPHRTGFAHLFEHLTFEGTVNIPDFDTPVQMAGGSNNAFTSVDITNYHISVPAQNIEMALWMEADRMMGPNFSQQSLEVQKKVVVEEFHQRYLNQPYGDAWHHLRDLAYKVHPYRWPTIGLTPKHIEESKLPEVKEFFFHHYAPNNAVLVISGNIKPDKAFKLAEKWFGPVPHREIDTHQIMQEPPQKEARELTIERDVPMHRLYMGWHMGARKADDFFAVDLLSDILSNGNSARLYQRLIKEKQLFIGVDAFLTGENDPGLFVAAGRVNPQVEYASAKKALMEEFEATTSELISEYELEKVKNKVEANLLYEEIGYLEKAIQLAAYEIMGDAAQINEQVAHYRDVSREQIRRVAREIFTPTNQNTLNYLSTNS